MGSFDFFSTDFGSCFLWPFQPSPSIPSSLFSLLVAQPFGFALQTLVFQYQAAPGCAE
jgi:hypothetical protein